LVSHSALGSFWTDLQALLRQPLVLEALAFVLVFAAAVLVFRRIRRIAETLERRRALAEYVRGLDDFLRGEHRAAIRTLEKVLRRDPENVEARIALGDCYREVGDPAEAKKHHHHVHRVFGHEQARNFLSLGRDELALGNFDLAVAAFSRALELAPGDPDAQAGLAEAHARGGNPVAAAEALRLLYPEGPPPGMGAKARREAARRFAEAGAAALRENDAEFAVRLFTEALAFQRENVRARVGLLAAAGRLDDPARARAIAEAHLRALRDLAAEGGVLFEPAPPRTTGDIAAAPAPPPSSLSALADGAAAVVAAVDERTARYACSSCGSLRLEFDARCGACGAVGTLEALPELEALYTAPLDGFDAAVDEVEGNAAFVQAAARKAALGDEEALGKLLGQGAGVLHDVFAALPAIEARRYLGERMAALGPPAAREVRECRAARARAAWGGGVGPHDEFAAAFHLALGPPEADVGLAALGPALDAALAGCAADPRLSERVRDAALERLRARGIAALAPMIAAAAAGDPGAIARAAALVRDLGAEGVDELERRFFTPTLLGRLFFRTGARRRAAADALARCGLPQAAAALARAAAREKDPELRAHYSAAKARAERGGPA
jgi:tetratricopeptide (TPR) repeat protein